MSFYQFILFFYIIGQLQRYLTPKLCKLEYIESMTSVEKYKHEGLMTIKILKSMVGLNIINYILPIVILIMNFNTISFVISLLSLIKMFILLITKMDIKKYKVYYYVDIIINVVLTFCLIILSFI
jgi:hypothetical protein